MLLQLIYLLSFHYKPSGNNPSGYSEQIYAKLQQMHLLSDLSQAQDEVMKNMDSGYQSKLRQVLDAADLTAPQQDTKNDSVFLTQGF